MRHVLSGSAAVMVGVMAWAGLSVEAGVHNIRRDTSADRVESPLRVALERVGIMERINDDKNRYAAFNP